MRVTFIFLFWGLSAAWGKPAPVAETRSTLEEWVLTEKTISAEREAWQAEKATMLDLIRLLRDEKKLLTAQMEDAQAVTTQAEARRGELLEEKERLLAATAALEAELDSYEQGIRKLQPGLPQPLQKRIEPLVLRLPVSGKPLPSVGQRMQNIVGILGEIDKFNREVTLDTQVYQMQDAGSRELQVLYFGLGAAFYADISGDNVGRLSFKEGGQASEWTFEPMPESAPEIREAIDQFERKRPAAFVNLPLDIQ